MRPEKRTCHICYAFLKRTSIFAGEPMRLDFLLIMIGILLAAAMVLTLVYGKEHSLHGYGANSSVTLNRPLDDPA